MQTVYGVLASGDGLAYKTELEQGALRLRGWSSPALRYRHVQDAEIPVDLEHDHRQVGRVVHLERDRYDRIHCVAHVSDDVSPVTRVQVGDEIVGMETDLFWSASRLEDDQTGELVLDSVALTASPARLSATPVTFLPGQCDWSGAWKRWQLRGYGKELLERACAVHPNRPKDAPIYIAGNDPDDWFERGNMLDDEQWERRPMRRSGARGFVIDVR
jgi:hypothetical protein